MSKTLLKVLDDILIDLYNKNSISSDKNIINILYDDIHKILDLIDEYINKIKKNKKQYSSQFAEFLNFDNKLEKMQRSSTNPLSTIRYIILGMIYRHKKLTLSSKDEFKETKYNVKYITIIGDTEIKQKLFFLYIAIYYFESSIRKLLFIDPINRLSHIGLDFEFNARQIALMQINFETIKNENLETNSYIWLINPGKFNKKQNNLFMQLVVINKNMYKILHGPESLDIPYVYDIMLEGNKEHIVDFTSKIFDTRYLCEYFKVSIDDDKKCSIYDGLKYFDVISKKKYTDLEKSHESMGPVQDISWDINKLSSYHIQYALSDVMFLHKFLLMIYSKIGTITPQYIYSYKYVAAFTRFIFLERKEITDVTEYCKQLVNVVNNYMIKSKKINDNVTLLNIYNDIVQGMKISYENNSNNSGSNKQNKQNKIIIDIDFIMSIGYYKNVINFLFKYITYYVLSKNFTIYEKKNVRMNEKIDITELYKRLADYDFKSILKLSKLFEKESKKIILKKY